MAKSKSTRWRKILNHLERIILCLSTTQILENSLQYTVLGQNRKNTVEKRILQKPISCSNIENFSAVRSGAGLDERLGFESTSCRKVTEHNAQCTVHSLKGLAKPKRTVMFNKSGSCFHRVQNVCLKFKNRNEQWGLTENIALQCLLYLYRVIFSLVPR